jgi:hypothetical protein
MPHFKVPTGAPTFPPNNNATAHSLIIARLRNKANGQNACQAVRNLQTDPGKPAPLTIVTASQMEDVDDHGNAVRPGERVIVFVNSTDKIRTDTAHADMQTLINLIVPLTDPANGQNYFKPNPEHY